jgi:hypothetical protein
LGGDPFGLASEATLHEAQNRESPVRCSPC